LAKPAQRTVVAPFAQCLFDKRQLFLVRVLREDVRQ
jgi:hypothetical protein